MGEIISLVLVLAFLAFSIATFAVAIRQIVTLASQNDDEESAGVHNGPEQSKRMR